MPKKSKAALFKNLAPSSTTSSSSTKPKKSKPTPPAPAPAPAPVCPPTQSFNIVPCQGSSLAPATGVVFLAGTAVAVLVDGTLQLLTDPPAGVSGAPGTSACSQFGPLITAATLDGRTEEACALRALASARGCKIAPCP